MVTPCAWHYGVAINSKVDVLDGVPSWCSATVQDMKYEKLTDEAANEENKYGEMPCHDATSSLIPITKSEGLLTSSTTTTTSEWLSSSMCLIHYDGFSSQWDEWVPLLSSRLSPHGTRQGARRLVFCGQSPFDRLRSYHNVSSRDEFRVNVELSVRLGRQLYDKKVHYWINQVSYMCGMIEPLVRLVCQYFGTIIIDAIPPTS
jgi:hypothetical protein